MNAARKQTITSECQHLLADGFETRRSSRKSEIEGLQDAKDVLNGGLR